MKRILCVLLVLILVFSLSAQAFAADDVLYCRICGRKIPTDSLVCPYCGEKVVHVDGEDAAKPAGSAPAAAPLASPAPATDVKTALSQSSAPSPTTQSTPAVPGPFHAAPAAGTSPTSVRVTKSPISETVPFGGSCYFIAHADNATSVTWYIANNDASIIYAAADAPSSIPGLCVSGANSDTLYLSGIPAWCNGAQVQACFTGEDGPVYSEIARIWTYQPAAQPTRCNWTGTGIIPMRMIIPGGIGVILMSMNPAGTGIILMRMIIPGGTGISFGEIGMTFPLRCQTALRQCLRNRSMKMAHLLL